MADALAEHVVHHPLQQMAALNGTVGTVRNTQRPHHRVGRLGRLPVDRVVVLAAELIVPDAGPCWDNGHPSDHRSPARGPPAVRLTSGIVLRASEGVPPMIGNLAAAGRSKTTSERARGMRLRTPRPAPGKGNCTAGFGTLASGTGAGA